MLKIIVYFSLFVAFAASLTVVNSDTTRYEPTWDSLDTRPLPPWYDEAKVGIFLHWGVFSVPSYGSEWFWSMWKQDVQDYVSFVDNNYPKGYSYQEFAKEFTAEFFDPDDWAKLFAKSGAKYVVLTSKHHEGFTLWPSKYSYSWNSVDIGPHRDLVGDLAVAVRNQNLTFGLYHSLYEWFNPMYVADKNANYATRTFAEQKAIPELYELIENYSPSVIWSDGDWEAPDTYWNSTGFLAWLYNDSPIKDVVVVNDRWGINIPCNHGDFYTCSDRYNPGTLQTHKWENAMTIDKVSWGFRRNAKLEDYLTTKDLLLTLAETVSCGGNLLINVGPTKDGLIVPIFEERLTELGEWLDINGESIYKSKPWTAQNDTTTWGVWYTQNNDAVYAIFLQWPYWSGSLLVTSPLDLFQNNENAKVNLLGNTGDLSWSINEGAVSIALPDFATVKSKNAWVLKITTS